MADRKLPPIDVVLDSPIASDWLKKSLRSALDRDCVDAVNDATFLLALLQERMADVFGKHKPKP